MQGPKALWPEGPEGPEESEGPFGPEGRERPFGNEGAFFIVNPTKNCASANRPPGYIYIYIGILYTHIHVQYEERHFHIFICFNVSGQVSACGSFKKLQI